jgi:hypothetical protein
LQYHYGLESLGLLTAAALLGWRRADAVLAGWGRHLPRRMVGPGLAVVAVVMYIGFSPMPGGVQFARDPVTGLDRRYGVEAILCLVPAEDAVSASSGLLAHLSHRRAEVYEFNGGFGVPWVVIDTTEYPSVQSMASGYYSVLPMLPSRYDRVASADGVVLWHLRGVR